MRPVNRKLANKFARLFADDYGFSGREITDYFSKYSRLVTPYDYYGIKPSRSGLFVESLYTLTPKEQYYALTDLCLNTPQVMKHGIPPEQRMEMLNGELHSEHGLLPIGLSFSNVDEKAFREDWYIAINRIEANPASAITQAKTMLETIFKTIISERKGSYENKDSLTSLFKKTNSLIPANEEYQAELKRIQNSMVNIVDTVSPLRNKNGDSHGLAYGEEIENELIASLVVNVSGVIGLYIIERHLFSSL